MDLHHGTRNPHWSQQAVRLYLGSPTVPRGNQGGRRTQRRLYILSKNTISKALLGKNKFKNEQDVECLRQNGNQIRILRKT